MLTTLHIHFSHSGAYLFFSSSRLVHTHNLPSMMLDAGMFRQTRYSPFHWKCRFNGSNQAERDRHYRAKCQVIWQRPEQRSCGLLQRRVLPLVAGGQHANSSVFCKRATKEKRQRTSWSSSESPCNHQLLLQLPLLCQNSRSNGICTLLENKMKTRGDRVMWWSHSHVHSPCFYPKLQFH